MQRTMLNAKIHRATVTAADLDYVGSITIDTELLKAAEILPYEQVQVVDIDNGARLETYVMPGEACSGTIQVNGAAAHLVGVGHRVIIMSYIQMEEHVARNWEPTVVLVDDGNRVVRVRNGNREALLAAGC